MEFATRTEVSTVVPHSNADAQDYHWGLTRFLDEARTLARFDHPHLNRVYRFFESNGTAYMVLEYINGETLADRLSREPFLEEDALQRLLDEVLSGLEVMHEAGYVHRDIKPGNLMLRAEDGSAVVLDFGAARQAVGQRSKPITSILTPGYAPIEQYDSKADDVGPWSDIYALGMMAYRCISGLGDSELPDAVTRGRIQRKGQVDLTPAIEAGKGRYSSKLLEAIDWAMAVDEGDRPQSVDAWRQALAGGGRRKSSPKSVRKVTTRQTRSTTPEHTGMRWSSVALTVVIVALVGVGAWWGWQTYPELFGQGEVDPPAVTGQEAPTDMPGETPQDVKTGETGEALASTEQTPSPGNEEIEQPASKEPALSPEEAEVTRLLAAAEADLKARRLTSPVGNNAWERYQEVLKLDSSNPDAVRGMGRVIENYMEFFGAAVEQEAFDKASGYLTRIRELHPDSPVLEAGEQRLEAAKKARTDRLAEQERQRQAEETARQVELERQRIAQAIEARWTAFEAALEAEDLDEAKHILAQVRDLNPEDQGLAAGEQRLEVERQALLERQQQEASAIKLASDARKLTENPNYWAYPGGNYNNWRYSELDQINNNNAGDLVAAWTFPTGRLQGHEGGPLVLPPAATGLETDHLFIHSPFPNDVFAIDLETLKITWDFVPPQDEAETVPKMCCDIVNRGLGYSMGQIYLQAADTTLYALNAKNGSIVWSAKNGADIPRYQGGPYGPARGMTNTNAPHPIKDKVFTGCSGAEFGVRCWIAAYNARDGSLAWRAFSMGSDADILFDENTTSMGRRVGRDSSLKTWCAFDAARSTGKSSWGEMALRANSGAGRVCRLTSDQWQIGGGSVWGWFSADFDENLMYYGSGNPGTWNPVVRPGDNKWSMSIFARDIDTGVARWVYQMTPHDEWGYDGVNEMILADMRVKGNATPALVHFDRNGFGYTMNRKTGELLVAEKYDPAVNWATHVDMRTGYPQVVNEFSTHYNGQDVTSKDICPATLGTKNQQPAAYSPKTGLFYVPTNHVCMTHEPVSYEAGGVTYEQAAGSWYVNANLTMFPAGQVMGNRTTNTGNFIAWDAGEGKIVWSIPERWSVWSGALATNGDVVFYGTLDGYAKAIDASSGKLLWQFKTPSGIIGNFNTWSHKGKQYVGVLSGIGGWAGVVVAVPILCDMSGDAALGAVGVFRELCNEVRNNGVLMVFSLP